MRKQKIAPTPGLITAHELKDKKFNTHRLLLGYDTDEVDEAIDQAVETLNWYEHFSSGPLNHMMIFENENDGKHYFDITGASAGPGEIWLTFRAHNSNEIGSSFRLTLDDARHAVNVLTDLLYRKEAANA